MTNLDPQVLDHLKDYQLVTEVSANIADPKRVSAHFTVTPHPLTEASLENWIESADYVAANPNWSKGYAGKRRKFLEHFASVGLAGVQAGGTYMDAASAGSPFYKVMPKVTGAARCFRQDLNFAAGVVGDTVGSSGLAIPLPDASLDGIVSHNAWEHFEGEAALGFLREARRLLKPGGRLCIIPLALAERTEIITAPGVWSSKYRNVADWPVFDPRAAIIIKEASAQRQMMRWEPGELAGELARIDGMDWTVHHVTCGDMRMFGLVGTRH